MGREKDPLRLMEAAYAFDKDERAWLTNILDVLTPYEFAGGAAAYCSDLGETISARSRINRTKFPDSTIDLMTQLPPLLYRRLHDPMPLQRSTEFFPRVLKLLGVKQHVWPPPSEVAPRDAWAFAGGDVDLETVLVVFHCAEDDEHSQRDKQMLDYMAAHLSSALRLRSLLRGASPNAEMNEVEAIVDPNGRVLDARGSLEENAAAPDRELLIDAVRKSERAKLRSASADERIDVWTALVEGRWSILENIERDGKRMLLICRNEPRSASIRALTTREQAVLSYAARGHSFKYIAYELGIAIPTVDANIKRALRKIGLKSRAELIGLLSQLSSSPLSP